MAVTEELNVLPSGTTAYNMPDYSLSEVKLNDFGWDSDRDEYRSTYSVVGGDGDAQIDITSREAPSSKGFPQGRSINGVTLTLSNVVTEDGVVIRREPVVVYLSIHDGTLSGIAAGDLALAVGAAVQPLLGSVAPPATDGGAFESLRIRHTSIID